MNQKIFLTPFALLIAVIYQGCQPVTDDRADQEPIEPDKIEEILPKERRWASPSAGIEPETNPPSFLWPISKEGDYSIRISQDSLFKKVDFNQSGLAWAIYNPHQKLSEGNWYWQVKSADSSWGPVAKFRITKKTRVYETPDFARFFEKIPGSHPRVLVFRQNLENLRIRAKDYLDSKLILQTANDNLKKKIPPEEKAEPTFEGETAYQTEKIAKDFSKKVGNEVLQIIEPVCQAFILTGDGQYIQPIVQWARQISSWDPEGPTRVNDFSDSQIMYSMALIYDSFYEHLSDKDKNLLLKAIEARGAHFYDHWINHLEARQVSNHVWQFNLYRLFMTSLAVIHDLPVAKSWMNYLYDIWLAKAPVLGGNDGAWVHGVSYFHINTVTLIDLPSKLEEISGFNFMQDDFYANNMTWLNYAYPPFSTSDGFSDGAEDKFAPDMQILGYVDALARIHKDRIASWYLVKSLDGQTDSIAYNEDFRWFRISKGYLMQKPPSLKLNDLPLAKVFPDVGMVYMHSNLNDHRKNFMVAMRSSPYGSYSHMHADQNTFNIAYAGQRLFFNSGYKVSMGDKHSVEWYKATQGHNGILINGQGQDQSSAGWGYIDRFISGKMISYASGEAAPAYNNANNEGFVNTFKRHLLMIHSMPLIVIYDELEVDKVSTFSWLIHSYKEIVQETDNLISSKNEVAKGWVYLEGSQPLNFQITNQFAVEPVNFRRKVGGEELYPDQWHFKAENKSKSNKMRFLAILQVTPDESLPEPEIKGDGSIILNGWQIDAQMDVAQKAKIQVKDAKGLAAFSSSGVLGIGNKIFSSESSSSATLVEIVEGTEIVKSSENIVPHSFHEAYYNQRH